MSWSKQAHDPGGFLHSVSGNSHKNNEVFFDSDRNYWSNDWRWNVGKDYIFPGEHRE